MPRAFWGLIFLLLLSSSLLSPVFRLAMATVQLSSSSTSAALASFEGLKPSCVRFSSHSPGTLRVLKRSSVSLSVRAATVVSPKYTSLKPLDDRVLVKIKTVEDKTVGGILLPTTAQTKPQGGEVVAVGEGKTIGKNKVDISVQVGEQVVYSKYAGTEIEFSGSKHLLLKEDDIVGILDGDDIEELKPLNDRVLIKLAEAEEKTAGGLFLTEATKENPSIGTVVAVGPGSLDNEGCRRPLNITTGNTVLYSKYAGNDFKGSDGSDYITLRVSDVIAALS